MVSPEGGGLGSAGDKASTSKGTVVFTLPLIATHEMEQWDQTESKTVMNTSLHLHESAYTTVVGLSRFR